MYQKVNELSKENNNVGLQGAQLPTQRHAVGSVRKVNSLNYQPTKEVAEAVT